MISDPFKPKQNDSLALTIQPKISDTVNQCIPIFKVILCIFSTQRIASLLCQWIPEH